MTDYPKHCLNCWNVERCKQKTFMVANTEPVQGYVAFADVWCETHKPDDSDCESLDYYPEVDSPMHCSECGRPLQCSLTDEGVSYVWHAIDSGEGCCRELWPVLFVDYFG